MWCRQPVALLVEETNWCLDCDSQIPDPPRKEAPPMTTVTITPVLRLTIVKHLANGRDLDFVASVVGISRPHVLEIASKHGYPKIDSLQRAVTLLEEKIDRDAKDLPPSAYPAERAPRLATQAPSTSTASTASITPAAALTQQPGPDGVEALLNTAKAHPAKRIQAAADKALDAIAKLRTLVAEDEERHAERRKAEAEKAVARAEVERLEKQLAAAKAKLRGGILASTPKAATGSDSAEIRAWARQAGIECTAVGRVPNSVREAFEAAQAVAS